jgi:hypothetical protein
MLRYQIVSIGPGMTFKLSREPTCPGSNPGPSIRHLEKLSATSRLLYVLLGRMRLGFPVVSPFRTADNYLHWERG